MKNRWFIGLGIIIILAIAISFFYSPTSEIDETKKVPEISNEGAAQNALETPEKSWKELDLTDIKNKNSYTISSLNDKPILLESFAVWCPTCTKQQREIKELHSDPEFGNSFYSIALNTDENENEEKVKEHYESNGFDWIYSVSTSKFTNSLIDEFGIKVVNAPSAPVILICDGNQETHFLDNGVKKASELKEEIISKCNLQLK